MRNKLLYNILINNISKTIYKSINENYFSLGNLNKNNNIINDNNIKDYICNNLLAGKYVDSNEIKLIYNYYKIYDKDKLSEIIKYQIEYYGNECNLNWINTSLIINMYDIFSSKYDFNGDISLWDVSNVTNMSYMFYNSKFNGDISLWDVSNVKDMSYMFYNSKFNNNIGEWDVSNVLDMHQMFAHSKFNQDISLWDVSNVTDMNCMFYDSNFNQDISNWNVNNVIDMSYMFKCSKFNQDISNWNVSNVSKNVEIFYYSTINKNIKYKPKFKI